MIYLFYTIIFTTAIYIVFKLLENFGIDLLQALVVNYLTASLLCFFFISKTINFSEIIDIKGKEVFLYTKSWYCNNSNHWQNVGCNTCFYRTSVF